MGLKDAAEDIWVIIRIRNKDRDVASGNKVGTASALLKEVEGFFEKD